MNPDATSLFSLLKAASLGALLLASAAPGLTQKPVASRNVLVDQGDMAACKASLNRIFEALQEYQKVHTNLPNYLSELHPDFIAEPRLFICPAALRSGNYLSGRTGLRTDVFEDVLPTTYSYEFCIKPYPLWCGIDSTCREFKERQMKILGPDVPVVRCLFPRHQICLSVGGLVFDSPHDWELYFTNRVPLKSLLPPDIFQDLAPQPGRLRSPIPPRAVNTDPRLIDLSDFYVASLDRPWVWQNPRQLNISAIPRGIVTLNAVPVPFDIRGVVQLILVQREVVVAPFPAHVDGIPIRQNCRLLHFLEGAAPAVSTSRVSTGTEIGHYQVRYTDGGRERIPIVYGRDVLEAWQGTATNSLGGHVAWDHETRVGNGDSTRTRLYHQPWVNPRPGAQIDTIDFVCAMNRIAPFLIAITLEP